MAMLLVFPYSCVAPIRPVQPCYLTRRGQATPGSTRIGEPLLHAPCDLLLRNRAIAPASLALPPATVTAQLKELQQEILA